VGLHTTDQAAVGNGGEIAIGTPRRWPPYIDTVGENPNRADTAVQAHRQRGKPGHGGIDWAVGGIRAFCDEAEEAFLERVGAEPMPLQPGGAVVGSLA
jgi:hypothetical protein